MWLDYSRLFNSKKIMGFIKTLTTSTGAAINVAYGSIADFTSEIVNISDTGGDVAIAVTSNAGGTPKLKIKVGMDPAAMDFLLDTNQLVIELSIPATKKRFVISKVLFPYMQIVGSANGTTSGALTDITIRVI